MDSKINYLSFQVRSRAVTTFAAYGILIKVRNPVQYCYTSSIETEVSQRYTTQWQYISHGIVVVLKRIKAQYSFNISLHTLRHKNLKFLILRKHLIIPHEGVCEAWQFHWKRDYFHPHLCHQGCNWPKTFVVVVLHHKIYPLYNRRQQWAFQKQHR